MKDEGNTLVPDSHASGYERYKINHEAKKTKKGDQAPNKREKNKRSNNNIERPWRQSSKTMSLVLVNRSEYELSTRTPQERTQGKEVCFKTEKFEKEKSRKRKKGSIRGSNSTGMNS